MTLAQLSLDCRFSAENKKLLMEGKVTSCLVIIRPFTIPFKMNIVMILVVLTSFEVIKMFALWFISDLTQNLYFGVVITYLTS